MTGRSGRTQAWRTRDPAAHCGRGRHAPPLARAGQWLGCGAGARIPTSPALWRHVLPLLPGLRVLAFEMTGYGQSIPAGPHPGCFPRRCHAASRTPGSARRMVAAGPECGSTDRPGQGLSSSALAGRHVTPPNSPNRRAAARRTPSAYVGYGAIVCASRAASMLVRIARATCAASSPPEGATAVNPIGVHVLYFPWQRRWSWARNKLRGQRACGCRRRGAFGHLRCRPGSGGPSRTVVDQVQRLDAAGRDDRIAFLGDDQSGRALEVMGVEWVNGTLFVIQVMDLRATEAEIRRLADEAETGYDLTKARRVGRPSLDGNQKHSPHISFRTPAGLRAKPQSVPPRRARPSPSLLERLPRSTWPVEMPDHRAPLGDHVPFSIRIPTRRDFDKKVAGYVRRHLAQRSGKETSRHRVGATA